MSYINDALRKAQKEKDHRYANFGEVIAPGIDGADRTRRRRAVSVITVSLAVLASAALLFALYGLRPTAPSEEAVPVAVAAAETAAPPAVKTGARPADGPAGRRTAEAKQQPSVPPKGGVPPGAATAEKPAPPVERTAIRPPEEPPALRDADLRYQQALKAQRAGDLRRAETIYEQVLALDPGHVRTLNNIGVIYMEQRKPEKAIAVFNRAVALKKDYVDPYYNLACLYAQADEMDESLRYLKVAVTIDGSVINWVKTDADMKRVAASPEFKKIMEGQKN